MAAPATRPSPAIRHSGVPATRSTTSTEVADHDRGAEIGLGQQQGRGDPQHQQHRAQGHASVTHLMPAAGQEVTHPQQQAQLGELGRLDLQRAGAEPAGGAVHGHPDTRHEHQRQQAQAHHQERRGPQSPAPVVDPEGDDERAQADHRPGELPLEAVPGVPGAAQVADRRGRQHHDQSDQGQHRGDDAQEHEGGRSAARRLAGRRPAAGMAGSGRVPTGPGRRPAPPAGGMARRGHGLTPFGRARTVAVKSSPRSA